MSLTNKDIAIKFYNAFKERSIEDLDSLYHSDLLFTDPVFGDLNKSETIAMWTMLFEAGKDLEIHYKVLKTEQDRILVQWIATYSFGKNRRKVVNTIVAELTISNNLITRHIDRFNLYKWAKQALGLSGYLLGWTSFFRRKLERQTGRRLKKFMAISS